MNNKFFLFGILILISMYTMAAQQRVLSKQESDLIRGKIVEKSKNTTSIESDFVQYKHLDFLTNDIKSTGKLVYKSPNSIKWEYLEPFKYSAIFKNDKLYINDNGKKSDIDLSANKTFKSLNKLIIKSIKGDMFDSGKFDIKYYKDGSNYRIRFSPLDKKMKSFISEFVLLFDAKTLQVIEVKMIESSEDYTLLKFLNQKLNEPISNAVFSN